MTASAPGSENGGHQVRWISHPTKHGCFMLLNTLSSCSIESISNGFVMHCGAAVSHLVVPGRCRTGRGVWGWITWLVGQAQWPRCWRSSQTHRVVTDHSMHPKSFPRWLQISCVSTVASQSSAIPCGWA